MSLNDAFNWKRPPYPVSSGAHNTSSSEGDFYIDAGPSQPTSNGPPPSPASRKAAADDALATSIAPVLLPRLVRENPKQSAGTLISILAEPGYIEEGGFLKPFKSREMSCESRIKVIAQIRDAESTALWGAIIDLPAGRQLLATWLRESLDPAWTKTRMPLLRLLDELPVLPSHLLDKETNSALPKAVGQITKKGLAKSKELAGAIRKRWMSIIDPDESKEASGSKDKELVAAGPSSSKQGVKGAAPPRSTASDTMQSLNSLSQSSAYVSAVGSLAKPEGSAPKSKLALSGPDRSSDMQSMAKKTVTRLAPEAKEVCQNCKTTLIPGVTSTTRVKREYECASGRTRRRSELTHDAAISASGPHTQRVDQTCLKCNEKVKKTPAPPLGPPKTKRRLAIEDDDDVKGDVKRQQPPYKIKKTTSAAGMPGRDMFSDLLTKPAAGASSSSSSSKAGLSKTQAADNTGTPTSATAPPARTKLSKRVRWRDDANLVEVRMIENTRRDPNDPDDMGLDAETHAHIEQSGLHGLEMDEGMALKAAAHADDDDEEQEPLKEEVEWYLPLEVEVPAKVAEERELRGGESEEAKTQEEREKSVLSAIYMNVADIPATPEEATAAVASGKKELEGEARRIALPEGWDAPPQVAPQPDLSELMRQLGGGAGAAAAGGGGAAAGASLESYGISLSGLQSLVSSVGGGAQQQQYQQYQQQQQHGGWQPSYGGGGGGGAHHHHQQQQHNPYLGYPPAPHHHYGGY